MIKLKRYSSGYIVKCAVAFDGEGFLEGVFTSAVPMWSAARKKYTNSQTCLLQISDSVIKRIADREYVRKQQLRKRRMEKLRRGEYL